MEEILACRVCLATDTRLYNMYKYKLISAYEILTGTRITQSDGLPLQICSFCGTLLIKCVKFQERCRNTQDLLNYAILQQQMLSTDYIKTINRVSHNLALAYTKTTINTLTYEDFQSNQTIQPKIEQDFDDKYDTDHYDSEEEPLSKIKNDKKDLETEEFDGLDNLKLSNLKTDKRNLETIEFDGLDNLKQMTNDVEVVMLSKEEQIGEIRARKESVNYKTSFFKCELCFKGFMSDATYKNHMIRHDPSSGPLVCDICQTRWPDSRSLRAHVLMTHEKKYICKRCNHVSKSGYKAKEHSKWHDGFTYVCDICGASFSKSTSRLTHIRLQHPSNFSCDICGESFIGEYGLKVHKNKAHKNEKPHVKSETNCLLCGVKFDSADALNKHVNNICDSSHWPCTRCGDSFSTEDLLKQHSVLHEKEDKTVKCVECNRKFAHARSCTIHYQRMHLGLKRVKNRPSPHCDTAVCDVCGRTCTSKTTLGYHMRIHTGEKPYQCTACPKRFSIYQRLQIHIRTHTGERPYKCVHCPKAFKHKAALNRHDRVHTGAKPYSCQHCCKSFSQSNSLKMHVRSVHLKIPPPHRPCRWKQHPTNTPRQST